MPSLRQVLPSSAPLLILDASSTCIQVGVLEGHQPEKWKWAETQQESGIGLFEGLEALGFNPTEAGAFAFCEGPGSILGIRSCAAALRAWLVLKTIPCWSYRSLDLLLHSRPEPEACVLSDARRDSWHVARRGFEMARLASSELPTKAPLFTPEGFRQWTKLPEGCSPTPLPYKLQQLLPSLLDCEALMLPAPEPDAFLHEDPSYALWTPQIHRAPAQGAGNYLRKQETP